MTKKISFSSSIRCFSTPSLSGLLIRFSTLFILISFFANSSQSLAQSNDWLLEVSGKVLDDSNDDPMEDVLITLLKGNSEISRIKTTANGTFLFKVPSNDEFTLKFSKVGFTGKIVSLNTKGVPKELSDKTSVFNFRGMKVFLFEIKNPFIPKILHGEEKSIRETGW